MKRKTYNLKKYKREYCFKTKYNLTLDEHLSLYIRQNGCCAICKKATPLDKIQVDHNHKTNRVRGLLCRNCNLILGHAKDNMQILSNAVAYIQTSD